MRPSNEKQCSSEEAPEDVCVFDAGAFQAGEGSLFPAEIRRAAMKRTRESGRRSILLYNLGGRPEAEILWMLRAARRAGFENVRLELPLALPAPSAFIKRLMSGGAQEVHLLLSGTDENERGFGHREQSLAALKTVLAGLDPGDRSRVRVKFSAPRGAEICGNLIRGTARAGAQYIIVQADGFAGGADSAALRRVCRESAVLYDTSIELRLAYSAQVFHGAAWKQREAASLLLDIPYAFLNGKQVPLGAVFQLGFHCGQRCVFCTSDRTLPDVPEEIIRAALARVLRRRIPRVVFTGGEPTLNRHLTDYIAMCKAAHVPEISLYTNGMAAASKQYAARLVDAGLDLALVSLHSSSSDVSYHITRCRGGFEKTTRGIENLLNASVLTIINFVVNGLNYRETPRFAAYVKQRFPGALLNFSYVAPVREDTADTAIIPRFRDAVPFLMEALDACEELGVVATGLEPHWGMPPCMVRADRRYFPLLPPLGERFQGFIKANACKQCSLDAACPGVRKYYAAMYGMEELSPVGRQAG